MNHGEIPNHLVHRYRHDASFHHLVQVIFRLMGEADVVGADVREASVVAAEMIREQKIQTAIHDLPDPVLDALADRARAVAGPTGGTDDD